MAERYEELVAEIERVSNSPYPTQLKRLRDIVCMKCTEFDVSRWAMSMPCQIEKLVSEVLGGLRHWPYVLEIVEKLSTNVRIRDELLRQEPTLLRDIVVQATKSGDIQSKYTMVATAILSSALPKDVSIPAEVQTLFVQAFEYAAEDPSVQTVKPIYRMLKGISTILLGLLSSSVLLRLEEQIFGILRNIRGDNQSLSLYCLAIMKVISSASDEPYSSTGDSYDTQELLASTHITPSRWTPDAIKQFFSESKAQKTMQLVVLRAMWACTTTSGDPLDDRIESLDLANEVIAAVPVELRETWRKANTLVARKLEEKTVAPALEPALQLRSLCFLLRLTEGHVYPATAMDRLRQKLIKEVVHDVPILNDHTDNVDYITRNGVFDQSTTTTFIQNAVDFVTSASLRDVVEVAWLLESLLHHLRESMTEQDGIGEGTMLAIDVLSCGQKLEKLAKLDKSSDSFLGLGTGICTKTVQLQINSLVHGLCDLFLTAAFSFRHSTYSVSRETTSLLLNLHASSARVPGPCSHMIGRQTEQHSPIAFLESTSTQHVESRDWREALQSHFQLRKDKEREALFEIFARSCAELEARCQDVEGPLMQEKKNVKALQQRYDDLNQAYTGLEAESIDRNIQSNALEMERDQCVEEIEALREEKESLLQNIGELEHNLHRAKAESVESVAGARRSTEIAELAHATSLAEKEEELDAMEQKFNAATEELESKTKELENAQSRFQEVEFTNVSLRSLKDAQAASNDKLKAEYDQLRSEKDALLKQHQNQEIELERIRRDAQSAAQAHQLQFSELQQHSEHERAILLSDGAKLKLELIERHETVKAELERQLRDLGDQRQQAADNYSSEIQRIEHISDERQQKIERLKSKCDRKDKQIAEANAMRGNLMAAMGITGNPGQQRKLACRSSASSNAHTQHQDVDTQIDTDPSPPTPLSGNDDETQADAGASFASSADSRSGPTPKRTKPRRSVQVHSPARPRVSAVPSFRTTRASTARSSTVRRQPLLSVSANQSSRKDSAAKTPSKMSFKVATFNDDESTFEGSELFAGTPEQRMLDFGSALDSNPEAKF